MYLFFVNVCFEIVLLQIVGELMNNELERCGRKLSWPIANCQEDLRIITKNCSHDDRSPGRDMNSKLANCQLQTLVTFSNLLLD